MKQSRRKLEFKKKEPKIKLNKQSPNLKAADAEKRLLTKRPIE